MHELWESGDPVAQASMMGSQEAGIVREAQI